MRAWLGSSLALAAMLGCAGITMATPVAPNHMWLFNTTTGGTNNSTPDGGSSNVKVPLYGTSTNGAIGNSTIALYAKNDGVPARSGNTTLSTLPTALNYVGNKVFANDVSSASEIAGGYPSRIQARGQYTDVDSSDMLGDAGTIAFWINPIRHDGTDNSYPFMFGSVADAATSPSDRLYAFMPKALNGDYTGAIDFGYRKGGATTKLTASGTGFSYGTAADGGFDNSKWFHLAFTWAKTGPEAGLEIFVNGVSKAANSGLTGFDGFDFKSFGLSYYNLSHTAAGLYDEVAIWNSALSASDISWLAGNSLTAIPEPASFGMLVVGLIGFARFRRKRLAA